MLHWDHFKERLGMWGEPTVAHPERLQMGDLSGLQPGTG